MSDSAEEDYINSGHGRRASDNRSAIRLGAIASGASIFVVACGVVLWVSDALIADETRPLYESIIKHDSAIKYNQDSIIRLDGSLHDLKQEMNSGFEKLNDRFDQLQSVLIRRKD